jgi:hypothetical protein
VYTLSQLFGHGVILGVMLEFKCLGRIELPAPRETSQIGGDSSIVPTNFVADGFDGQIEPVYPASTNAVLQAYISGGSFSQSLIWLNNPCRLYPGVSFRNRNKPRRACIPLPDNFGLDRQKFEPELISRLF